MQKIKQYTYKFFDDPMVGIVVEMSITPRAGDSFTIKEILDEVLTEIYPEWFEWKHEQRVSNDFGCFMNRIMVTCGEIFEEFGDSKVLNDIAEYLYDLWFDRQSTEVDAERAKKMITDRHGTVDFGG